jgi:hypothetical protein
MSGTSNALPVVPTFSAGAPTLYELNQLSYCVNFLVNQNVRPAFHAFKKLYGDVSPASVWQTPNYGYVSFDCDGMWNDLPTLTSATVQTQGYYVVESAVQFTLISTIELVAGAFLITGGGNNPHLGSGDLAYFGFRANVMGTTGAGAADYAMSYSDITPFCLYPADTISPIIASGNATVSTHSNLNTAFNIGRFVYSFSGKFLNIGT